MRQTCLNCGIDSEGDVCPICHKYDDSDYVIDDSKPPRVVALERELADARAEIDRLKIIKAEQSENVKELKACIKRYGEELSKARAEIERLKVEANKWRTEAKSKNDARLNLESDAESIKYWAKQAFKKVKMIEQMREALKKSPSICRC